MVKTTGTRSSDSDREREPVVVLRPGVSVRGFHMVKSTNT